MKTLLTLTLCLLLAGCGMKSHHRKTWDAQGNLKEQVDICLVDGFMQTQAQDIAVISGDNFRMLFVGDFSQIPDTEAMKGGFGLFIDLILKGVGQ